MRVEIDDKSGFCFGVVRAITMAEGLTAKGAPTYSLGDIVHNRMEVQRLERLGMVSVGYDQMEGLKGETLLVRAHGEPPQTYIRAKELGIRLVDATCVVVERLQGIVREAHEQMQGVGGQVVILGKKGHAEVVGLSGQVGGDVVVVECVEDLEQIDFKREIYLLSQTTQSLSLFRQIRDRILERVEDVAMVTVHDTVCRQVVNREQQIRDFAKRYDAVVFVSGKKSSNGHLLYQAARETNERSYMVESEVELKNEWFIGAESVGVCGATSTPKWLMERVAEEIRGIKK